MEHKLSLTQFRSIHKKTGYEALLAFFESAVPNWDSASSVDATGIRVSDRMHSWLLLRMIRGIKSPERESMGMTFVNIGPGCDSDLVGANVRIRKGAVSY